MRAFVQIQKVTQQKKSANSTMSAPVLSGQSRDVNSLLYLQRMIGTQAVQRLLQTAAEDQKEGSIPNAAPRFTRDFSRIPLHPTTPTRIQPKLEISTPGDQYEQEADRVADQIMRMPASKVNAAQPRIQRMPRANDHQQAEQTLRAQDSSAATESEPSPATEASVRSLDSGGEPLNAAMRAFFEPRFGHSFDQVRVHTDAAAAASSQDLNALAYTRGRHIVFAPGRFEPHTERGQRLLAHELTHVVQQGSAGPERIQRSYVIPTPDAIDIREVPRPAVAITAEEDETPIIQRAPGPDTPDATPAPALASPTITFSPSATIVRGDTLTARVGFSPTAGETLKVTDWRYTAGTGTVTRPKTDAKFQSEWKGKMALSGTLELSYEVKPTGKPAVAGTAVTAAVTVNDRSGAAWQTTLTDLPETPLPGAPSPPELARQLGLHDIVQGYEPAATETPITSGPNAGFTFVDAVADRDYKSQPHIHPDVANAASAFRVFHRDASRLYHVSNARVRRLVPLNEYTVVSVSGSKMTSFNVPDWTKFYQKYGIYIVTVSDGRNTVPAQNAWWALQPNTEAGTVTITNPGAVRAALQIGAKAPFNNPIVTPNGHWETIALMPSAKIEAGTRSHEYTHATHSHRANFHKMVRALDPRRVLESTVSTPSSPVTFKDKIHDLLTEIKKPDHELVDEAQSKTAGRFVPIAGQTMAAVNQDPAGGASLGVLWDITHDRPLA
jgi:hypothetical protein